MGDKCSRCGKKTYAFIISMFDKKWVCLDCKSKEENHPQYNKACQADLEAVRQGNFTFKGIGKPEDL
jgi:hypothetical protein